MPFTKHYGHTHFPVAGVLIFFRVWGCVFNTNISFEYCSAYWLTMEYSCRLSGEIARSALSRTPY